MIYKTYGNTGKKVSAIGFGAMRFDMSKSLEENAELVRYANKMGINYFDTAPGYCDGKSEDIFGIAFGDMPGDYYVSTKGMPVRFDTKQKAKDAVKSSLEKMKINKIDFYHIWCIRNMSHYELAMKPGGQYEGLLECKEEGLIDHIVFSSHQPGSEIKTILEAGKVEGVLLGMNILNFPYRWDGAQTAYEMGYGVVAMNPLGGGAIPSHEDRLSFIANKGETPTEAALRFIISCPQITVALNGFTTKEHIDMACRVSEKAKPFTDKELDEIRQNLGRNMNEACTGCGYCLDCPQKINIPGFMQIYNEKHIFGCSDAELKSKLENSYNWGILVGSKGKAAECIECGRCEEECTQHLPIIQRLKELDKLS